MYEEARKIFEYLPIRQNKQENDYIDHLWQAFSALDGADPVARPFAIMLFHLLFMTALQYKVLRIFKEQKDKYELALTLKNPRDEAKDVLAPESPLAIAFLGESEIVDLLKIGGLSAEQARSIKKSIVRYRNDKVAHAKGYVELDIETKIDEYFSWLESLQTSYQSMNRKVAYAWLEGLEAGEDVNQFLETHLLSSCFCPRDFGDIVGILLKADKLDLEQWKQILGNGLAWAEDQTFLALRDISTVTPDRAKRFNAVKVLHENAKIDNELRKSLQETEKRKEILDLLKI